jgi:hypothetical protein
MEKPEKKTALGKPRSRLEDNIKTHLKETECEGSCENGNNKPSDSVKWLRGGEGGIS